MKKNLNFCFYRCSPILRSDRFHVVAELMEYENLASFFDVKNYITFNLCQLDEFSVLLCFTTKPVNSDSGKFF